MKNQSDWINAIRITKETDLEKPVISYLKKCSKNSRVIDLPCYIDEEFLTKFDELRSLADIANTSNAFGLVGDRVLYYPETTRYPAFGYPTRNRTRWF